jgi:hypothetical protein
MPRAQPRFSRENNAPGVDTPRGVCYQPPRRGGLGGPQRSPQGVGCIAQLVEQLTLNQRVQGSNPCAPTKHINHLGDLAAQQFEAWVAVELQFPFLIIPDGLKSRLLHVLSLKLRGNRGRELPS